MPTHDRMIQLLQKLIVSGTKNQFKLFFHRYHEADIAEVAEDLSDDEEISFFWLFRAKKGLISLKKWILMIKLKSFKTLKENGY